MKLTQKQRKFIEVYAGNATEAARIAGYKGNADTLKQVGAENLAKPYILEAIKTRENKELKPLIATREERQKFWTGVMSSEEEAMQDRLRASELLGKSEADFIAKIEHSGTIGLEKMTNEEIKRELDELRSREKK